jgi:hypothetical protein
MLVMIPAGRLVRILRLTNLRKDFRPWPNLRRRLTETPMNCSPNFEPIDTQEAEVADVDAV